jgi:hypothetical protein
MPFSVILSYKRTPPILVRFISLTAQGRRRRGSTQRRQQKDRCCEVQLAFSQYRDREIAMDRDCSTAFEVRSFVESANIRLRIFVAWRRFFDLVEK